MFIIHGPLFCQIDILAIFLDRFHITYFEELIDSGILGMTNVTLKT